MIVLHGNLKMNSVSNLNRKENIVMDTACYVPVIKCSYNFYLGWMRIRLACRRSWVRSSGQATFFPGDWSWNHFYRHSLPTAHSSRAVVSYWWKDVHLVLVNRFRNLPRNSVVRLTDRLHMTVVVDWDVQPQIKQIQFLWHDIRPLNDHKIYVYLSICPNSRCEKFILTVNGSRRLCLTEIGSRL